VEEGASAFGERYQRNADDCGVEMSIDPEDNLIRVYVLNLEYRYLYISVGLSIHIVLSCNKIIIDTHSVGDHARPIIISGAPVSNAEFFQESLEFPHNMTVFFFADWVNYSQIVKI
jgi:hypothetical protein